MSINLNELTIGQIKEIKGMCGSSSDSYSPWEIGKNYVIRCVTMIQLGRLVAVTDKELILEQASWIADTGLWNEFLTGEKPASEVEPFRHDTVTIVNRGAIVDAQQVAIELPTERR